MKAIIPDNVVIGQSIYDANDSYLGDYVECLSDGPDLGKTKNGSPVQPGWTLGDLRPSQALCDFQRGIWNMTSCWGVRNVFHQVHGIVKQACVKSPFDDSCVWINI